MDVTPVYLDLERPSDLSKLSEPENYFEIHKGKLIILDEIQRVPDLFPVLRPINALLFIRVPNPILLVKKQQLFL